MGRTAACIGIACLCAVLLCRILIRSRLILLLYRLAENNSLYEGALVLTQQDKILTADGDEIALTLTDADMSGYCAFLERLYVRRTQKNVKYALTLRRENGIYVGEIINTSKRKKP